MQSVSACPMNETGAHTQPDKPGRMIVATRLNKFRRIGNNHTSFVVVCPFHASGDVFFLLVILFFTDFPLKFFSTQSASVFVYLHFAPFSKPHQSVIFVLGTVGEVPDQRADPAGLGRSVIAVCIVCGTGSESVSGRYDRTGT